METLLIIFHVLLCIFLIAVVLLQTSRGAEIGAAFGGASRTLFGASGAPTVMGKVTAAVAIFFMVTSIVLTRHSERPRIRSIMDKPAQTAPAPVLPEAKPVQPADHESKDVSGGKNQGVESSTVEPKDKESHSTQQEPGK